MGIHVPSNVPMESTPFKGMEFEADEIAYGFYNEYGRNAGFSIRKEYVNKCKDWSGYFKEICVCEGGSSRQRQERSECKESTSRNKMWL